jgi:hypothetical protein
MLDVDRLACRVRSWGGETDAGLHPATGGDGSLACSADMLLEALVACAGVTVSAVATAMGVKLRGGRVVTFELDTDADAATVQRLVEMRSRGARARTRERRREIKGRGRPTRSSGGRLID